MRENHKILRLAWLAVALLLVLAASPAGWSAAKHRVLHAFGNATDGAMPWGPLTLDDSGKLYGVTLSGGIAHGSYGSGTVFRLSPRANGKWKETILYKSPGGDYSYPHGGLVIDSKGNLYGTMPLTVFELTPGSGGWNFSALYTDGAYPGLLMDGVGNLYGGMGPGQYKAGAIGELSPGSGGWNYAQLYSFCNANSCPDGVGPPTPPIWDGKGNMFGTTTAGGIYKGCWLWTEGCGVIYEMTPNGDGTWTYHVLHRFLEHDPKDGQQPYSGLVMDKDGNFYGATANGGQYDQGTVFKFAYSGGWKETIIYDFPNCAIGCGVAGTLAMDKAGNLYGTAGGGTGNCGLACGVVFKLSPQKNGKWKYSVVLDLNSETGGAQPLYGVILDGKGNLFGVTSHGGKYGFGTAFEIIP